MNYGLSIIVLAILDVLVIFSGLPTGWKKTIVLLISIIFVFIGWMMRAMERRKKMIAKTRAETIENIMSPELEQVVETIAHDINENVEYEIDHLAGSTEHVHYNEE